MQKRLPTYHPRRAQGCDNFGVGKRTGLAGYAGRRDFCLSLKPELACTLDISEARRTGYVRF